jgi:hypothetical protein
VSTAPPALPADLIAGLKRLKMGWHAPAGPELPVTAKTQRWSPEEFLRTLVEAEITARDASNARTRRRLACFPVTKTLEEFDVVASSIPRATVDYVGSLEWVRAAENLCLIGPGGPTKITCSLPVTKSRVARWAIRSRFSPRACSKSNSSMLLRAGNRAARMRPSPPCASRAATCVADRPPNIPHGSKIRPGPARRAGPRTLAGWAPSTPASDN